MKSVQISVSLGLVFTLGAITSSHAIEVMRWERLPLAVPLIVGQERVVFVERNVRVGVPASLGDRLRVQSAAGTVYLRANEPIEPTRLQLQDATTGELILWTSSLNPHQRSVDIRPHQNRGPASLTTTSW